MITYSEAEEMLRVSRSTLRRLIRDERLTVVHVTPATPRILLSSVERYLRELSDWEQ